MIKPHEVAQLASLMGEAVVAADGPQATLDEVVEEMLGAEGNFLLGTALVFGVRFRVMLNPHGFTDPDTDLTVHRLVLVDFPPQEDEDFERNGGDHHIWIPGGTS
jgi:hypothetical protein